MRRRVSCNGDISHGFEMNLSVFIKWVLSDNIKIPGSIFAICLLFIISNIHAAPQGGNIVGGTGNISQSGLNTTINQNTQNLAIDWNSFNVNVDADSYNNCNYHLIFTSINKS